VPLSGDAVANLRPVGEVMSASCSVGNAALFSEARAVMRDRAVAAEAAVTRDRIRNIFVSLSFVGSYRNTYGEERSVFGVSRVSLNTPALKYVHTSSQALVRTLVRRGSSSSHIPV
jgi:hypothetical protein